MSPLKGPTDERLQRKVLQRTLHTQVAREIGLRIMEGELPVGMVLPNEAGLGTQFGVSRTALREAIKVLESKGLVEVRRKTGTRVRPRRDWNALDPEILNWLFAGPGFASGLPDLLELRMIVEPAGARLAAERATAHNLNEIEAALRGMEASIDNPENTVEFDLLFHLAILDATQNGFMRPFGALIQEALRASFRLTNIDRPAYERSLKDHRSVFEAIEGRNPDAAEAAMRIVLNRTSEDIERSIVGKLSEQASNPPRLAHKRRASRTKEK